MVFPDDLEASPTTRSPAGHRHADEKHGKMSIDIEARPDSPDMGVMEEKPNAMYVHFEEVSKVKQGLHQRHIQMIALAGTM
jgi:amino acid permease